MDIYWSAFWILLVLCFLLYGYTRQAVKINEDVAFISFQKTYLVVYLLAMAGDWLQGPYVYALYQHYGMKSHEIDILFVVGFFSSMVFGTLVASSADKFGRRNNCILYALLYSGSCITKHFANFWVLLIGRVLGGTATSILFSAFESWVICEHNKRGFSQDLLPVLFTRATLGNSLVAISAGHLSQVFADMFGYVSPFDLSLTMLIIMILIISTTWTENYGDSDSKFTASFSKAFKVIKEDPKVRMLGIVQAFFEASMYTFVLKWTPALTPVVTNEGEVSTRSIPHGLIFASFMVAVMIGSSLFKILTRIFSIESFMRYVFALAAVSLAVPVFIPSGSSCILLAFCLFEICVGLFWPSLGTLRGMYVPEGVRSTVMNFFRVPLNLIVIAILVQDLNMNTVFLCCAVFLVIALLAQHILYKLVKSDQKSNQLPFYNNDETLHSSGKVLSMAEDLSNTI